MVAPKFSEDEARISKEIALEPGPRSARCPLCSYETTLEISTVAARSIVNLYSGKLRELVAGLFEGIPAVSFRFCQRCSLEFFEPPITGSAEYYGVLQQNDWYYLEEKAEYEIAARWIGAEADVLEVGCGAGEFGRRLPRERYTGLEFSPDAIQQAQQYQLKVYNESIESHSAANRTRYDVCCSFQVLEHVSDPAAFLRGGIDCLRPGGLLLFAVPSADSYVRHISNTYLNMPPHHVTWWRDSTLQTIPIFFPLELVSIEHEKVSDIHLGACTAIIFKNQINRLLRRHSGLVNESLTEKVVNRCAYQLAKLLPRLFADEAFRPAGHTVVAVYRKRGAA